MVVVTRIPRKDHKMRARIEKFVALLRADWRFKVGAPLVVAAAVAAFAASR